MKVLLGFSGGVDSSIAAYLLKKQGHEVVGAFMRNWDAMLNNDYLGNPTISDSQCPQEKDYQDAVALAKRLDIPLKRIDFVKEYWDDVFQNFLEEYKRGRTPNPDVLCNSEIKFGPFLAYAKKNGFDAIAMGHYAKKVFYEGHYHLAKPKDSNKDQTYFLCNLKEEQIAACFFPMEDITKVEARELAHELGLKECESKHGSTGICFIGERNFRPFLENYLPAQKGNIIEGETGKVIGEHEGVMFYTLGQRKGLGIGGISGHSDGRWYVYRKDVLKNELHVAQGEDEYLLLSDESHLEQVNWVGDRKKEEIPCQVRFRYRMKDVPCSILLEEDGKATLHHQKMAKAVTPGQWAAIYSLDGVLLGGGIVASCYRKGECIS